VEPACKARTAMSVVNTSGEHVSYIAIDIGLWRRQGAGGTWGFPLEITTMAARLDDFPIPTPHRACWREEGEGWETDVSARSTGDVPGQSGRAGFETLSHYKTEELSPGI
jgi:hypothetical protein